MSAADGPPSAEALLGLGADAWAALLPVARRVLRGIEATGDDEQVRRLLAVPAGRLASGPQREAMVGLLRRVDVWRALVAAWPQDRPRPWQDAAPPSGAGGVGVDEHDRVRQRAEDLAARVDRLDERLRGVREERDRALEEAERAVRDRDAAEELAAEAEQRAGRAEHAAARLEEQVVRADRDRSAAVERARRRTDAQQRDRDRELTDARRELEQARTEVGRLRTEVERLRGALATRSAPSAAARIAEEQDHRRDDGRHGRPSVLPAGTTAGTRAATEWLLAPGTRVLVDGYNVTRTHRDDLDLEGQRRWLVDGLATLTTRTRVQVLVVFDAALGAPSRLRARPDVSVRFTEPGLSADDELVFELAALSEDEPVVVVTDDRELRGRLAPHGPDLLRTHELVPLLA